MNVKKSLLPGAVTHVCNPSYLKGVRIVVRSQPRQKVSETHLNKNLGVVVHTCHANHMEEGEA
jgi:hypothetical protein